MCRSDWDRRSSRAAGTSALAGDAPHWPPQAVPARYRMPRCPPRLRGIHDATSSWSLLIACATCIPPGDSMIPAELGRVKQRPEEVPQTLRVGPAVFTIDEVDQLRRLVCRGGA